MKKQLILLAFGLLSIGGTLYAANGDLIVNGNLGVGGTMQSTGYSQAGGGNGITFNISRGGYVDLIAIGTDTIEFAPNFNYLSVPQWEHFKIFRDGTNVGLQTTGTTYLAKNGGNVGIGTTNPDASLQIIGTGGYTKGISLSSSSSGVQYAHNNIYPGTSFPDSLIIHFGDNVVGNGYKMHFQVGDAANNPTTIMTLQDNGNVGIGTTSPAYMLDVAGQARINGTIYPSDIRYKKNVNTLANSLNKILELHGVSYEWKKDEYKEKNFPDGKHYGVIAQEIEKVLPEVVSEGSDGMKAVAYTEIIPVLIEAIKEQQKAIKDQQARIEQLEKIIAGK